MARWIPVVGGPPYLVAVATKGAIAFTRPRKERPPTAREAPRGSPRSGPASPMRQDLMQAVTAVTSSLWPGVQAVPMMVMGGTDGLYLRAAGIPTYGVQGIFYDRDDIRFHGRDERVKVQSLYEAQTFLYELVKRLVGGPVV